MNSEVVVMKHLMILTVGICLLISVPAMADQAADEEAIKKVIVDIFETHNRGDGAAMAAHYDGDGYYSYTGVATKAAAIEAVAERQKNKVKAKLIKEIGVVFLKPDVAIERRVTQYSGPKGIDGKPFKVWNLTASVLMKKNGKWLVTAQFYRPMTDEEVEQMKKTP
jgi:ketosteroid isomerase-like protein